MADDAYHPMPLDTADVVLPRELTRLAERLARNVHEVWARERIAEGWQRGPHRDDLRKEHPQLVPYDDLPEREKDYDRRTVLETMKAIHVLGFVIVQPGGEGDAG